jgi:hypothetical protein
MDVAGPKKPRGAVAGWGGLHHGAGGPVEVTAWIRPSSVEIWRQVVSHASLGHTDQ